MSPPILPTNFKKAPLWRRFAAMGYDGFILLALSFAYGALITALGAWLQPEHPHDYSPMFNSPLILVGWIFILFAFYWYFWRRGGQTIGMKTWRLQLVQTRDGPLLLRQLIVRSVTAVIGLLLIGTGYFYRLFNPTGDCLHDKLSGTAVVVVPKQKT